MICGKRGGGARLIGISDAYSDGVLERILSSDV